MKLSPFRFLKRRGKKPNDLRQIPDQLGSIASAIAAEFDPEYYLDAYEDVRDAGADPLHHFVKHGWREGRDPNPRFSTSLYLELHADVRDAGINPFWHYIIAGRAEGRPIAVGRFQNEQVVRSIRSIKQREDALEASGNATLEAATFADMVRRLAGYQLIVSISHDDYNRNIGGVQSCIKIEEKAVRDAGADYLHLHPTTNRAWLAPSDKDPVFGVTVNGEHVGSVEAGDLLAGLVMARSKDLRLVIHSLLGHDPEWVVALSRLCTGGDQIFWTHDHTAVCPSYTLLRNDVVSCDGPALSSRQCGLCAYGEERASHFGRVSAMLNQINPIVVSPSEFSRRYFREHFASDFRAVVVEHCDLEDKRRAVVKDGPIRVAFVGTPARHKGWLQFVDLVDRFGATDDYEFHVFGPAQTELAGVVTHHPVSVTQQGRMAMVEALRREDIDLAFLWSTWQETFCLAAYEAVAAGSVILTSPRSGNITSLAVSKSCGTVFEDFGDVCAAFTDGRIASIASRRRRSASIYDLHFSRMSLDAWQAEVAVA